MNFLARLLTPFVPLALITGLPGPALAAASFTWSYQGDYGVFSRSFHQPRERDIYVQIRTWSPCVVDGDEVDIYVYLYKDDTFNNRVGGTKKIGCTGLVKWSEVNPGRYYFRLLIEGRHRERGTKFRASGTTYYDGSKP